MVQIIWDCSLRLSDQCLREKDSVNVKYCGGGLCSSLPAVVLASPKKMASDILFEAEVRG